ncbi:ANTAR domain-containing protein [Epibacterium sp. SM1969]|uniref:ANTAR domain-containing protein n=1 Tax=Tritonibacter aquimaris TaxID=2663379 RepID=A0A844ANI6_9RHOB|nr:ANTAR domain-containing protein [Tritonibacter aquimaris]MQY44185.1 ANTAR domain-containing protein [Tritonibacter aquimaris]
MLNPLSIVVAAQDRGAEIVEALAPLAPHRTLEQVNAAELAPFLRKSRVDLVVADLPSPSAQRLDDLTTTAEQSATVVLTKSLDPQLARMGTAVMGFCDHPAQLPLQVTTALLRFEQLRDLRQQLEASQQALRERKTIDRAKGIIMQAKGLDEGEAYKLLRQSAMQQGRRVADVAAAIVTASELLS